MWLDGLLIPAVALVNGTSIVQEPAATDLIYYHVELDRHSVIYAEGAPSESFVDDDSRETFDNANDYWARYPQAWPDPPAHYCAPRIDEGWELETIRRRLARRQWLTETGVRSDFSPEPGSHRPSAAGCP
jgi:hypothetical protein